MFKPAATKHYLEMGQEYNLLFAWVRPEEDNLVAQHSWVKCRDFLPDAIMIHDRKEWSMQIYRFSIDKDFEPHPLLALKFPSTKYAELWRKNISKLHKIENDNKLDNTAIIYDKDDVMVIKFSDFWMKHPSLISLYTFLIKIFSWRDRDELDKAPSNEAGYIMSTQDIFNKLLKNLTKLTYGKFHEGEDISTFHNLRGFVTTFSKSSKHLLREQLMKLG